MTSPGRLNLAAVVAALLGAFLILFGAVPHVMARVAKVSADPFDPSEAETQICEARTGRSHEDCDEETFAKSFIREADRRARFDSGALALEDRP